MQEKAQMEYDCLRSHFLIRIVCNILIDKWSHSYSRGEIVLGKGREIWPKGNRVTNSSLLSPKNIGYCFFKRSFEEICTEFDISTVGEILRCVISTVLVTHKT